MVALFVTNLTQSIKMLTMYHLSGPANESNPGVMNVCHSPIISFLTWLNGHKMILCNKPDRSHSQTSTNFLLAIYDKVG